MKAIILAAGMGSRLGKYTKNLPKGMLSFAGKSIIQRQLENFRYNNITDISIVTGYKSEKVQSENVTYYHNPDFASTNMVESLFCAEKEFTEDVIVSYSDILYESEVLKGLILQKSDIAITVDKDWKDYWKTRFGNLNEDLESLELCGNNTIKKLGKTVHDLKLVHGRYVGLMKFTSNGIQALKETYHANKALFWGKPWQTSGNIFQQAYMTDILQALIDAENKVQAYLIKRGWVEFDTEKDYELLDAMYQNGTLHTLISL